MIYTLKAPATAGEHTVTFHLDPSAAGVDTEQAEIVDVYSKVEQVKLPDLSQPVSLGVFLDFPDGENSKGYQISDTLQTPFSIVSSRIKSQQTLLNKHFAFLQIRPTLRALKSGKTHTTYQAIVPPDSSILCNHPWFFPALGFLDQTELTLPDGTTLYGYLNKKGEPIVVDSVEPKDPTEAMVDSLFKMDAFFSLEKDELDALPPTMQLLFSNYDRREDVRFPVGDGSFPAFAANFVQALTNVVQNVLNLRHDSIRIQASPTNRVVVVSKTKSPAEEIQFRLVVSIVPPDDFPFLAFQEALDSKADSEVSTATWPKPAAAAGNGGDSGLPLPLALLSIDSGQVPSGFHTGYGHGYCLATVNAKGKVASEKFALVSRLQRSLTVYFLDENKKKFVFPRDMSVYMNLRLF